MAIDFSRYNLQPQNTTPSSTAPKTPIDFSKYNLKSTQSETQPETSFTEDAVNAITGGFSKAGGALLHAVMPESINKQMLPGNKVSTITGKQEDIAGYREGKKLTGSEAAKDYAGTALELASYTPVGRGAKAVTAGVKGVAKLTATQLAKEGMISGALQGAGEAMQENKDLASTIGSAAAGGVIGGVAGPVLGKTAEYGGKKIVRGVEKALSPVTAYTKSAIENVKKAIPVTTLMKPGQFVKQPEKSLRALRVIHDMSPEITITREGGEQVPFNPKTADYIDTNEAVVQTKQKLFKGISDAYKEMTGKGFTLDPNGSFKIDGKESKLNDYLIHLKASPTTTYEEKNAIEQIMNEMTNMTHADGGIPAEYLQEYMPKLSLRSQPGYGNSSALSAKMNAKLQGILSDYVDQQFEKIDVPQLRKLKDDYASIKSVERFIFNEAKKEARKLDTSIASNLGDYGNAEMLSAFVNAARAATGDTTALGQLAKGAAIKGMSMYRKAVGDRSNFLRKAFEDIEKIKARESSGPGAIEATVHEIKQGVKRGAFGGSIDFNAEIPLKKDKYTRDVVGKFAKDNAPMTYIPRDVKITDEHMAHLSAVNKILHSNGTDEMKAIQLDRYTPFFKQLGLDIKEIKKEYLPTIADLMDEAEVKRMNADMGTPGVKTMNERFADKKELPKYVGESDLTIKTLEKLKGKSLVSKEYIANLAKNPDLKQSERDVINGILEQYPEGNVNVNDFAQKIKAELLPLERKVVGEGKNLSKYESISLPDDLRGSVKNYTENIYASPIKTSAGNVHFGGSKAGENYFGHTRVEDMADNKTRRVIEVQSDLYQKGRLEGEKGYPKTAEYKGKEYVVMNVNNQYVTLGDISNLGKPLSSFPAVNEVKVDDVKFNYDQNRVKDVAKLAQYNDPTAHFRMIREEIKKAAEDGKTKLQFPTGETAMKIEGLGVNSDNWLTDTGRVSNRMTVADLRVGREISQPAGDPWIITDVLGDGKFKAVPKRNLDQEIENFSKVKEKPTPQMLYDYLSDYKETFDISGKVNTNNPIYKFYEKEVQKYLKKFGGTPVVDDKGVSWIEVPIKKEQAKMPVEAFGVLPVGAAALGGEKSKDTKKK